MKRKRLSDPAAADRWCCRSVETDRTRRDPPADRWSRVPYGDLCVNPQGVMDGIMDFIGLSHATISADFRPTEQQLIENKMRPGGAGEIREELSWQGFLTGSGSATVARISGSTNRCFGYDWPE